MRSVRLRFVLALSAVVALCQALVIAWGFYHPAAVGWALFALALALGACTAPDRSLPLSRPWRAGVLLAALLALAIHSPIQTWVDHNPLALVPGGLALVLGVGIILVRPRLRSGPLTLLAAAALFLSGQAVLDAGLRYAENPLALAVVRGAAVGGFLTVASFLLDLFSFPVPRRGFRGRVLVLFLTGCVVRGAVLFASPDPLIDVYTWLQEAPGHLLRGENPYAADYSSPYGTERARRYGVAESPEARPAAYPPWPILLSLPFTACGVDVRWANVACDLAAALALLLAARQHGGPLAGALLAGIYLHFPRAPFLIEQAWYEPMLAAPLGVGLLLVGQGRRWGYGLVALGLTGKQFGVALLPPLLAARRGEWLALLAALALVLALVFLPFFLAGPPDFLSIILWRHLERPPSYGSLTVQSACHNLLGLDLPRGATLACAGLLIAWVTWATPRRGAGAGLWCGTALLVFCLGHTQGYFNYFYLCAYLWLLGIGGLLADDPTPVRHPAG